jgi:hypothetical protein
MVGEYIPAPITADKFGVMQTNVNFLYTLKEEKTYKEKVFFNKDSAEIFYNEAINHNFRVQNSNYNIEIDYKIDSVKFKIVK